MSALDLTTYLVIDPEQCGGAAAMLMVAEQAIAGGVSIMQLRAPTYKKREWLAMARDLLPMCRAAQIPLLINDHLDVALGAGADGVHVGQADLPVGLCRQYLGPEAVIGLSTNRPEHFSDLALMQASYVGIGPVFSTSTKLDAAPTLGIAGLEACLARSPLPAVAIGGIGLAQVPALAKTGTAGVAVVSAICRATDPRQAAADLKAAWMAGRAA